MTAKTLKYITLKRFLSWGPCSEWTEDRFLAATGGRRRITPLEVCDLPDVSPADKLWLLLRPQVLPENELRLFACWCAGRALRAEAKAGRKPDPRSYAAVRVARAYARGKATLSELDAAREAVGAAAWEAWEAAREVARAAAWAAWEAEGEAAWEAAWAAERDIQLRRLRTILKRVK